MVEREFPVQGQLWVFTYDGVMLFCNNVTSSTGGRWEGCGWPSLQVREADEGEAGGHGRIEGPGDQNNQVISY
jgi:hypothetical protein